MDKKVKVLEEDNANSKEYLEDYFNTKGIDEGIENKSVKMQIISDLLNRPKKLLATILVANNFINIAIVLLLQKFKGYYFKKIFIFFI